WAIGDADRAAEERAQPLLDARLEDVRAPFREGGDSLRVLVTPEHGDTLAGERHGEGEPHVPEADDENSAQSRSPSATSRIAFSRSPWRPTSSQYSLIAYAATRRPPARSTRIR